MDLGGFTLTLAILGVMGWLTFLVTHSRVRRRREAAPSNLAPFLTDDELETNRLSRVLVAALIATAVIAIVMPVYYLNETDRQEHATDVFHEIAVERGEHWYEEFQCGVCHGVDGGGGGASFIEPRSGISTTWAAPSINDVLYRYTEDEVRYWLVFGRQGTPMPAWGIEGGGPMNSQQIDELIAYLDHIQISQEEAVDAVDTKVSIEINRLANAEEAIEATLAAINEEIGALAQAPTRYTRVLPLVRELNRLLTADELCTAETAALLNEPCASEGIDTDRDGVSDEAEQQLNEIVEAMLGVAPPSNATAALRDVRFDAFRAFSTSAGSTPVPDLDLAEIVVAEFESIERNLRLTVESQATLFATALAGRAFVNEAAQEQAWVIDFERLAEEQFDGRVADAQRGAALYNAYCARCHTAGFSAGITFTREPGSGAFGPSLEDGRSVVQFPDPQDHLQFIINGSVNGQAYGVNGIGRGWMPGFGTVLSEQDLMLIVRFERGL